MHCHTKYSIDALPSLDKIFKQAKKRGLDGIAITDHDNTDGWSDAIEAAKKYNMQVVLGEEIKSKNGDILALFIKEEIRMRKEDPEKVINKIHRQGGIAIIPHPFDNANPFKNIEKYIDLADGIEVFNSRRFFNRDNKEAQEFYKKHPHLCFTAGSDAHAASGVGYAYIESPADNLEDFKKDILNKKVKWFGQKAPMVYLLAPSVKKIKNLF